MDGWIDYGCVIKKVLSLMKGKCIPLKINVLFEELRSLSGGLLLIGDVFKFLSLMRSFPEFKVIKR